jgi:sulfotransferase
MPAPTQVAKLARKFHFISGLPRSGSTLLAAILNQNPRFRAGMASPLADIMGGVMAEASSKNDFSFDVSDEQRVAMLCGLVENFYAGQADACRVRHQSAVVQPDAMAGHAVSGS